MPFSILINTFQKTNFKKKGDIDFWYNIPISIYSSLLCSVFIVGLICLSKSDSTIEKTETNVYDTQMNLIYSSYLIKVTLFFIL